MTEIADLHAPTAIELRSAKIRDAEVVDSATTATATVRCVIGSFDSKLTTDPSRFNPVSTPAGWFYPKKGDRAIVIQHEDGPDTIIEWWPGADAKPDVAK